MTPSWQGGRREQAGRTGNGRGPRRRRGPVMHPLALILVVTAAVAHAGWNLCAKRVPGGGVVFVWLYGSVTAALCVPLAVVTVLMFHQTPSGTWLVAMGISGVLHVTYFVVLQRGYAVGDLSVVYPLARG